MAPLKFETVNVLPAQPEPGAIYFVRRPDGDLDTYVTSKDGIPVQQRVPHVQMHVESTPGLLPAGGQFGRYYATEALELDELLSGMRSDVAASNVSIVQVVTGGQVVANATFNVGSTEAVIDVIQASVPARSLLSFVAPAVQDPTLSGVVGTFVARRV